MIQLQRASAGSGKTYTLAKYFIRLYISIPDGRGGRRLRNEVEMHDSLRHILAITFTNKATNEMKERIVARLADMAGESSSDSTPYFKEFRQEFGVTPDQLRAASRKALSVLLHEYSDFQISTIDSFFQTVLRTFAYEVEMNDAYRIELDTDFLSRTSIDSMLSGLNDRKEGSSDSFWVSRTIDEAEKAGSKWNLFAGGSAYTSLLDMAKLMEKEQYKNIQPELETYFATHPDYHNIFLSIDDHFMALACERAEAARNAAARFKEAAGTLWHAPSAINSHFKSHVDKIMDAAPGMPRKKDLSFVRVDLDTPNGVMTKGGAKKYGTHDDLTRLAGDVYAALDGWMADPQLMRWTIYKESFARLGMLSVIGGYQRSFMNDNNILELGQTNSILARIIGDDDTPFIYERLGTRLNHFLIDEFQDTSAVQWANLRPLLSESESRDNDNLIIGDAKQSIYRFRNADASLISTVVPREFPRHDPRGLAPEENTNWRSSGNIVRFNNSFFRLLSAMVAEDVPSSAGLNIPDIYSNTVQPPHHKDERGYVEASFVDASETSESSTSTYPAYYMQFGDIVNDMRSRGYAMRDIAFLVTANEDGRDVIAALMDYNAAVEPEQRVEFISEESLLIGESPAVKMILNILRTVSTSYDTSTEKDVVRYHRLPSARVEACMRYLAVNSPELSFTERVEIAARSDISPEEMADELISGMYTVALPALVEAITDSFVPADVRRDNAAFISAFQDLVLDYCDSYPSDVASFLVWWDSVSDKKSIASPDTTDAVRIMTIHKSKGLEFKCVIIPRLSREYKIPGKVWSWVSPELDLPDDTELPPYIPVHVTKDLEQTPHAEVYAAEVNASRMDAVNAVYVGFTRAVDELRIFAPVPKKNPAALSHYKALKELPAVFSELPSDDDFLSPALLEIDDDGFRVGMPPVNEDGGKQIEADVIDDYYVNSRRTLLVVKNADIQLPSDPEDDPDPRSEGNVMHFILGLVHTPEDLDRAVADANTRGLISSSQAMDIAAKLRKAISDPVVREWFRPGLRVINERSLMSEGKSDKRPDRIVVDADGNATVIDYKFGVVPRGRRHLKQVGEYMELLKEVDLFRSVSGWLWYVREGKVISVVQDEK